MIVSRKISVQGAAALLAAFAAVVLLAALPSPAAAISWSLPATDLSDGPANNAYGAQVAVAVDGATTVVWRRWDGFNYIVQASTRPAGSVTFGGAVDLSAAGRDALGAQVAVAVDGATTVVWTRSNGSNLIVQASTRAAGSATFGAAVDLSATTQDATDQQVAIAADGATTVVWRRLEGLNVIVQARTRPAGPSTFSAAVDLSAAGRNAFDPQVAVAADGATTVVWRRDDGSNFIVQASTRPAGSGSGTFGAAQDLSAAGLDTAAPEVAVAVDGVTTVVWSRWNGVNSIVQASTRPAGSSTFGAAVNMSATTQHAYVPRVAVAVDGATTVVWYRYDGSNWIVQASTRPAGSSTFDPVVDLSAAGRDAYVPQLAVAVDGATTVVWTRSNGSNLIVQASTRAAGSATFGAAVNLSATTQDATDQQVAVAADGTATVVWRRDGPTYRRIQESTSGATPYLLTLTRSGAGSGSVSSSPAGIDCGLVCSYSFSLSTSVTLTATPAAGSSFAGWSGSGCSGTSTCTVTMLGARAVNAEFAVVPPGQFDLMVSKSGTGSGTVSSSPAGINCGSDCSETLADGTSVTLTASPAGGSSFTAWSGAGCSGTSTCTVVMSEARAVTAQFTKQPSNLFPTPKVKAGASALVSTVRVPGPGTLTQRVTRSSTAAAVLTVCKTSKKVTKAGRVKLTCKLSAATRAALRKRSLRVSVKTTFTPTGGLPASKTQAVTLKSQRPPPYTG